MSDHVLTWVTNAAAGAVALAGFTLAVRALFRDRSRGRARCPSCWYEMTGVSGLTCPECGRDARKARRLFRTRRRWWRAAAGCVLVLLGAATAMGVPMLRQGIVKGTPTWVYIAGLAWIDGNAELDELRSRAKAGDMPDWEYSWLRSRVLRELERQPLPTKWSSHLGILAVLSFGSTFSQLPPHPESDAESCRISGAILNVARDPASQDSTDVLMLLVLRRDLALPLLPFLAAQSAHDRAAAVWIYSIGDVDAPRLGYLSVHEPTLLPTASSSVPGYAEFESLYDHGPSDPRSISVLLNALRSNKDDIRAIAALVLLRTFSDAPEIAAPMCNLIHDNAPSARELAVRYCLEHPTTPAAGSVLDLALADANANVWSRAVHLAAKIPSAERKIAVERLMRAPETPVLYLPDAAVAWTAMGGDPCIAAHICAARIAGIESPIDGAYEYFACRLVLAIGHLGCADPEVVTTLRSLMVPEGTNLRATAALARAMLHDDRAACTAALAPPLFLSEKFRRVPLLRHLLRYGLADVPTVESWLDEGDDETLDNTLTTLALLGSDAKVALPKLHTLAQLTPRPEIAKRALYVARVIEKCVEIERHGGLSKRGTPF